MTLPINLGSTSGNPTSYNIQRSLRFRSSASAYLSRTPAVAGNRQIWTWNGWVKRGQLGASQFLLDATAGVGTRLYFSAGDNLQFDASGSGVFTTSQVFRDPSAWYMITLTVDTTQATAANRVKLYINGSQITAFSASAYPAQNASLDWNNTVSHYMGRNGNASASYLDGYCAEINSIDGQALTPTAFGAFAPVTGVWGPAKYVGSYGTNGFYLPFSDNTSATTLVYDKSGNSNNWTPNNISTTSGASYDSMTDVPTLTSATAANFATLNPLSNNYALTLAEANLKATFTGANSSTVEATHGMSSGKWYSEYIISSVTGQYPIVGITINKMHGNPDYLGDAADEYSYNCTGNKINNNVSTSVGTTFTTNDVMMVAFDADNGKIWWGKNGTWIASGDPAAGTNAQFTSIPSNTWFFAACGFNSASSVQANFGQRPFSYTPPTGFKALNTFNLPDPTIKKPNQYMDATTYTGNNTTNNVVNSGAFQPDFAWIKCRSTGSTNHMLLDSVRPNGYSLNSNTTNSEGNFNGPWTGFNSNGFGLGADGTGAANANGATYVGWQWKKGATPGFDIVTYTGNGTSQNISHSLGIAPKMVIVKSRSAGGTGWPVYVASQGAGGSLYLHVTSAWGADTTAWNNTAPTSSVFSVGSNGNCNTNAATYVAYLFSEIPGFSKFGSYTGNGSADGPFVYCGFRPKYVMIKSASGVADWYIFDSARETYNPEQQALEANLSNAEDTWINHADDFLSNGFKVRNSWANQNTNGHQYIFACFAENPFKYSLAR